MIPFHLDSAKGPGAPAPFAVSVIGIGGSGTNVIDKMALEGMPAADLVSMNCDARALSTSMAGTKLQLGRTLTQGLGCGGDPELGAEAAQASEEEIRKLLEGRTMVFICAGLGGGTASGAAPVVARMAREAGAFVVVFATLPFVFEGRRRSRQAGVALQELRKYANALVTFENDRMGELVVPKKGVQEAFELADKIIGQSVRAVSGLVTQPGLINIGMDDLVTALRNTDSRCLFGYGQAKGESRAVEALATALKSPLLDRGQMLSGARNVLVHICGGSTLTLFEIETLMRELGKHVHEDAQILFGAATDAKLQESLSVTILTSLAKPVPVAEAAPEPAKAEAPKEQAPPAPVEAVAETAPVPSGESGRPSGKSGAQVRIEVNPNPAESGVTERKPQARSAPDAPPAEEMTASAVAAEPELFPESVVAAVAEPLLIEVPAVKTPVRKMAPSAEARRPVPVAPPKPEPEPEPEISDESEEEFEAEEEVQEPMVEEFGEVVAEEEEFMEEAPAETPPQGVQSTSTGKPPVMEEELEDGILAEEEMMDPELEPEAEPVVERVIRIDRIPPPASRRAEETAPPPKRFALSDIINQQPVSEPVTEYEAEYEAEAEAEADAPVAVAPARASTPPATRRAPDFDRVAPIRPISAGRNAKPAASPFTASKPIPASPRQVPTHQQTFDERLHPASAGGGRFERAKPTVEEGEDLDIPTFLRRSKR